VHLLLELKKLLQLLLELLHLHLLLELLLEHLTLLKKQMNLLLL
jgi:hypothetical protein